MKKIQALLLAGALALTLAACGGGGDGSTATPGGSAAVYTVEVSELDPTVYPDDYPLIPFDEFEAAFDTMVDKNLKMELESYQDIVDIFGVDGAYYVNNDVTSGDEVYKYYGWYADNEASVLFTFKAEGNKLEYFAYTSNGI